MSASPPDLKTPPQNGLRNSASPAVTTPATPKRSRLPFFKVLSVPIALVIAFVLLMKNGTSNDLGWNGVIEWQAAAAQGGEYGFA